MADLQTDIKHPRQNSTAIELGEPATFQAHLRGRQFSTTGENESIVNKDTNQLKKNLSGRHMQMIAIGKQRHSHPLEEHRLTRI